MKEVWVADYNYGGCEVDFIGVYSTREKAQEGIDKHFAEHEGKSHYELLDYDWGEDYASRYVESPLHGSTSNFYWLTKTTIDPD